MFDEPPTFMPARDDADGIVAIYDRAVTRAIWLRRYDDISADGIMRWPVTLHVAADDLDADKARKVAACDWPAA
jgi:hypothetical protein